MSVPSDLGPVDPKRRRRQILTAVMLATGLVGLGLVTRSTLRDSADVSLPGPGALIACFILTRAALSCTARAWVGLVGPPADPHLVRGAFYSSQLVKYVPAGGVVQAVGQIAITATHGISVRRVSLAYLSLAAATVVAGLTLGAGLSLDGDLDPAIRVGALAGLAMPALMDRRVLAWVLRLSRRITVRIPDPDLLPDQRALWGALAWSAANLALYAAGFTVLLRAVGPHAPSATVTLGYIVSWVAGFLVLPLPSGVGVREAVLVVLVPGVTAGPLLAASLAQRLVAIGAEVSAAGTNRAVRLYHQRLLKAESDLSDSGGTDETDPEDRGGEGRHTPG